MTAPDWRNAANYLVDYKIQQGMCFSSGEIVAELRTHRPTLRFSATNLGEHIRDLFYSGGMPHYDDASGIQYPVQQVPRTTQGLARTPAGVTVFVYGPSQMAGSSHHFEVDIPSPQRSVPGGKAHTHPHYAPTHQVTLQSQPGTGQVSATLQPSATPTPPPAPKQPIQIQAQKHKSLEAHVIKDRRLCIPRPAFEAFVHKSGKPLVGGKPVHIVFDGDILAVTLIPGMGSRPYDLSNSRGRIFVTAPSSRQPFTPGARFQIDVSKHCLTVDLSKPLT
jgi:hypothetical protein